MLLEPKNNKIRTYAVPLYMAYKFVLFKILPLQLVPLRKSCVDFENTNAYKWLTSHAQDFGFELSFPPNNLQGVSYEPWHWCHKQ